MDKLIRYIIASCLWTWCFTLLSPGAAQAQSTVGFSIEAKTVVEKDTFTIAIKASDLLTGKNIYAFRFGLTYNADYLEFLGIDSVGTVLKNWDIPTFSNRNRGTIILAGAGTSVLSGNGNLFYLKFKALRAGGTYISNISGVSLLNEGSPKMTLTNAYIQANSKSYPDIYPDNYQLFVGEEMQMHVNGGAAPYIYNTVDTAVAVISDQTKVKAKGPGFTKAYVTDNDGEKSYMSGNIDVRAVKMSVMGSTAWPKDTFYLPVKIEIAPGTKVYSGYFELTYNGNVEGIKESVQTGDYVISLQRNAVTNLTRVSFASANGITGNGILCYLGFKAINSGNHWFEFQNMKFNENLLAFAYHNYVEVYYLPTLNMSPNSGTLMWGATQKITVTNGAPPLSYSLSNPALATIDELGNLSALSGGKVKVTATDTHGATITSGDFTILDNQFSIINTDGDLDHTTRVPISTSPLPAGKFVYDFDGTISFVENDLEFIGLDPAGSSMLTEFVQTGNSVHIVGATSTGIPSGIICYLKFRIKNTLPIDGQTTITINSLTANESSLFSTTQNGKITRVFQISYRPVANAGINKSVSEGAIVQLDGSGSYDEDLNPITYSWTAPAGIDLNDSTLQKPTFTAPEVNVNTIYTFTLVVNDGTDDSDPSTVKITVLQINKRPVANAGPDKSYNEGLSSVSLDGSLSSDPDGDVISYKWTSLDGIILFDALGVSPTFNTPQVNADKNYRFKLEVADGVLTSFADTVVIKIVNLNKKPLAYAGGDQTVNEGAVVQLDGSSSADGDDEAITYKWTAPANVVLSSTTASKPTFTAPLVHLDSVVVITLVVNDGHIDSDPDNVSITIKNLNILSTEAQILNAELTVADSTEVDQALLQVNLYLPYGTNPSALAPTFQISPKATILPASGSIRNFTSPVNYTVTAEDGVTKKVYSVRAFIPTITLKRTLEAGWNWISLSVVPPDLKVTPVLGSLTLENLDYIKSATASAVYYPAGWFGDLVNIPQLEMLMFKKTTTQLYTLSGKEINPTLTSIPVSTGWNRIGYIMKGNAKLSEAFDPASLPTGDILLKSKEASAVYYPASGWTGDLDSLRVLTGYMMKTVSNANLKYMAGSAKLKSAQQSLFKRRDLYHEYQINPPAFENSANLIGELVNSNNENVIRKGDLLLAYSQNEPRGVTEACFVPDLNRHVFVLTMFSNSNQEKLNFRIKSLANNSEEAITEELIFNTDEVYGQAMNPFQLHLTNPTGVRETLADQSVLVYPNPVTDELHILSEAKIQSVTLSGLSGNCIQLLSNISEYSLLINTRNLVSGMYMLKIETSKGIAVRKLIKSNK